MRDSIAIVAEGALVFTSVAEQYTLGVAALDV